MPSYNCNCDDGFYDSETLSELRSAVLIRLGYAAQVNNPPPGMAALINSFLQRGQAFLYRRYRALQTERIFTWPLVEGERFYGLRDNDNDGCTKRLDSYKITSGWVEDLNGVWLPLRRGIDPAFYTAVDFQGIPSHYEIRQCIEVFPAPSAAYTLHVKGHFGLGRFTEDSDTATVDSELLFLWALANAKNHYRQPDAADVATQAQTYLREIVAGSNGDRRHIPGVVDTPQVPQPVFLPLVP